jgi:tRNA-(ms[2]io[6]A)-hydroxylase
MVGQRAGQSDEVFRDHLHCERKAAQSALSLLRGYPDHVELVSKVTRLAHEETSHVIQVTELLARRGVTPSHDLGDELAQGLRKHVRKQEPGRLIDHLLVFALIEARSAERLGLLGEAIPDPELAKLYRSLAVAELRHRDMFLELALGVGRPSDVHMRAAQ